jgi:deoxyadenosine/deoxycytidine kinase
MASIQNQKQRVFFVEGNIGSGKTSFLAQLAESYPDHVQVIYEPVAQWEQLLDTDGKNILDYFYSDMKRYSYLFQSAVFLSRIRSLEQIEPSKPFVFIERSVDCDSRIFASNCFENGDMTELEWKIYSDWHDWLCTALAKNGLVPSPSEATFVYLRTSPDVAFGRMQKRSRASEAGVVPRSYIEQLHARHDAWLRGVSQTGPSPPSHCASSVVVLDGDRDFIHDKATLQQMLHACIHPQEHGHEHGQPIHRTSSTPSLFEAL